MITISNFFNAIIFFINLLIDLLCQGVRVKSIVSTSVQGDRRKSPATTFVQGDREKSLATKFIQGDREKSPTMPYQVNVNSN
jgi:hypothetical protein